MPKMKTHSGAKRRMEVTRTGKVMRVKGPKSHLRRHKSIKVKRKFGGKVGLSEAKARVVRKVLMPYSG
jgi:large subunit ribosomal protein L35